MSAENLDVTISYEQLQDLEDDFEDIELDIIRHQYKISKEAYAKREQVVAKIPHFWPLALEQAPSDIDDYIQPSDSAVLLGSLESVSVERFELPEGDPRSLSIRFEFADNEYFEDRVLEKKFWWRRARDGWAGLVSEPVDIKWKSADKDLTGGLLGLARKVWEEDQAAAATAGSKKEEGQAAEDSETKKKLREEIAKTGLGGVSFFAWFGFRGRDISPEEDREAFKIEQKNRQDRREGKEVEIKDDEDDEDDEENDDDEYELEIHPTADDLAVAIAEDLWPNAIKYFIQAQEQDAMSDMEFESDEEDESMADGDKE